MQARDDHGAGDAPAPARRVALVHDERYFWHRSCVDYGPDAEEGAQMESPEPRRRFLHLLDRSGLLAMTGRPAVWLLEREDLLRAHDAAYLDRLERQSAAGGGEAGDSAPFGPGSFEIACLAAGGAYSALAAVATGAADTAFALVRPPGHHAERARGRGYCLLANIPLAVLKARAELGVERVAVIDWDVHHGNGTQSIFYEDADVLTISLHQDGLYPHDSGATTEMGRGPGLGTTINVPLPAGCGAGAYDYAFERLVEPAVHQFGPEFIVVACGFDAGGRDPTGRMLLSAAAFGRMTRRVLRLADECCGGLAAFVQEGGYSPLHMPFCGVATVAALLGVESGVRDVAAWLDILPGQEIQTHQRYVVERALSAATSSGALG